MPEYCFITNTARERSRAVFVEMLCRSGCSSGILEEPQRFENESDDADADDDEHGNELPGSPRFSLC
jgi:hypothetical protein